MSELRPLRPGEPVRLGDYQLLGCIGEGGQGLVYLARSPAGVRVAIKVLQGRHAEDAEARRRFLREIEAASKVAPFCTARVLDYAMADGHPYVVSEFIEGQSLQQRVASAGPLVPGEWERLAIGTAAALVAIHRAGIIHRDFKPANVLLGPGGPRVVDFGIARILDATTTSSAGIIGTPSYMSPEQASDGRVGTASDLFSWAGTMVFAATGNPPFGRSNLAATVHRIVNHPCDVSGLPKHVRALVERCLEKTPERRPSAREVLLALVGEPSGPPDASVHLHRGDHEGLVAAAARKLAAATSPPAVPERHRGPDSAPSEPPPGAPERDPPGPPRGRLDVPGDQPDFRPRPAGSLPAGSLPAGSRTAGSPPVRRAGVVRRVVSVAMSLVVVGAILAGLRLYLSDTDPPWPPGTAMVADRMFAGPPGRSGTQVLNAVAASGDVIVAAGGDTTGALPRPLFLTSRDRGRTWRLGDVTGQGGPEPGPAEVQRVAGGDGHWLAMGDAGVWTSTDGHAWKALAAGELTTFRSEDRIADIARTSSGFVVVGAAFQDGMERPAVWTFADGDGWVRVDSASVGRAGTVRGLTAVVAKGDTVVALGARAGDESGIAVLRSLDAGRTWLPAASWPDVSHSALLAVASGTFVLVPARTRSASGETAVHCSPDGAEWSRCGSIAMPRDGVGVTQLSSSPKRAVALAASGLERYAVYTSENGREWHKSTEAVAGPGATLRGLAVSDSGTFVMGGDKASSETGSELVLMTASPGKAAEAVALKKIEGLDRIQSQVARLAAADGRYVVVGAAAEDAAIWTGTDGRTWSRIRDRKLEGPYRQELSDVTHGRAGWLAAGSTGNSPSSTRPLLLASADGRTWRRIQAPGPPPDGDSQPVQVAYSVAAGSSGYVIAGSEAGIDGAEPVVWVTADLRTLTRSEDLPASGSGVRIGDVAATASGYVAVGGSGSPARRDAVLWVSSDGARWTARPWPRPSGVESAELTQVVATGDRITAAGAALVSSGEQRPFAIGSADNGSTWTFAWLPAERKAAVRDLATTADGLVAVGWHGESQESDSAVWTSADGRSWRRQALGQAGLAGAGAQWLNAITISGPDVVAVGRSTSYRTDHLTLWHTVLDQNR
ncbi:serine/threonine-protein kinase [Nonomuraea zeae]|uniref:serine/threonine-protein kinase n=1 Tax=Nonomuraea zeae TaxID=1642303 RepID=UPI0014786D99|nr:serine/threonine-protein kinase [Nonomuraea zeae]